MEKVIKALATVGKVAVTWAKNNKSKILHWLNIGMTIQWIVDRIKEIIRSE